MVVWSNDFDAIGYDVYINCGYTDTILIVSKKKYGRDKAVGYISFVVVVVVVVRLWSFGFAVPLFVSFRERTFALVSTTFTTTRCLERFLSLSLCVCVFFDVFCASLRGPLFVTPFRRETHIFHACVWGGASHVVGIFLRDLHEIVHAPLRHQIEQTGFHFTSAERYFHRFQNLRRVLFRTRFPVFEYRRGHHVRQSGVHRSLRFHVLQKQMPPV